MDTPIRGLCSMATRALLDELAARFAQHTGVEVRFLALGGVEAARRIAAGEPFDVAVLASDAVDRLAEAGKLDGAGRVDLVRSHVGMAVRAGAARPDVSTGEALRAALLSAPSIGYSTGPSGTALVALLERWGMADRLRGRLVQAPPGVAVGSLVARGDAAIGFQQMSELVDVEGIALLGSLAPEARISTVFSGAPATACPQRHRVAKLLAFIASAECDSAIRRHGLQAP